MFDLELLIKSAGYIGIGAIVFTESGLLFGVILPGDSLLFTAGFLSSQGYLNIVPLMIVSFVCAVLGDNVGYWLGRRFGRAVFSHKDSLLLDPGHIARAEAFYETHGPMTIILARFMPVIRTIAPVLAGVGTMHWPTFMRYNLLGGLAWGVGMPLTGYFLGSAIPGIDRYIIPIVGIIVIISVAPGIYHLFSDPLNRAKLLALVRRTIGR
jgi:membrane-associated protein